MWALRSGRGLMWIGVLAIGLGLMWGCERTSNRVPKPNGYFRIDLPNPRYLQIPDDYPYRFEVSQLARIQKKQEITWMNLVYPSLNASIHITYRTIESNFAELVEESRDLAFVHAEKADGIAERVFTNDQKNVYALLYEIEGNTASNLQFVATDSTRHFLRGALYFNSEPNFDSIQPVLAFFQKDIAHLIESLEWNAE